MLTRIYVDNFRCLVNFELKLDRLNLLLGENGSGKTTVFEVLRRLQEFIGGTHRVDEAFWSASEDLTRWQKLDVQRFELEFKVEEDVYVYSLAIQHDRNSGVRKIKHEELQMNQRPLFAVSEGNGQFYGDDFSPKGKILLGSIGQSGIALLQGQTDLALLRRFHKKIARIAVVRPIPMLMGSESSHEDNRLSLDAGNFASWYRYLSQEHQGNILELTQQLREVIPGFDSFSLQQAGEKVRVLKVLMRNAKDATLLLVNRQGSTMYLAV